MELPFDTGALELDLLLKLVLAVVLGGAVGWERETSGKPAGLRTNILICLGATLLTDVSLRMPLLGPGVTDVTVADPARLAAQIVSGIGFLGAGTIIQARGSVTGLTTAATLWVVAAIGIAIGVGGYVPAVGSTLLVLLVLVPMQWMEKRMEEGRTEREMVLTLVASEGVVERILRKLKDVGLDARRRSVEKPPDEERLVVRCVLRGPPGCFREARELLLSDPEVLGFRSE